MIRIFARTAVFAFAALTTGGAVAGSFLVSQSTPGDSKASFESLDKNADGKVSLNEAADNDALFVAFKRLDTNRDGLLTREEFAAFQSDGHGA